MLACHSTFQRLNQTKFTAVMMKCYASSDDMGISNTCGIWKSYTDKEKCLWMLKIDLALSFQILGLENLISLNLGVQNYLKRNQSKAYLRYQIENNLFLNTRSNAAVSRHGICLICTGLTHPAIFLQLNSNLANQIQECLALWHWETQ